MRTATCFKKGDMVKVINPNDKFYDEVGKILLYDHFVNKYLIQFDNGYKNEYRSYDLVKNYLKQEEQRKLQESHLMQLADLALELKDKEWFESICRRLKIL